MRFRSVLFDKVSSIWHDPGDIIPIYTSRKRSFSMLRTSLLPLMTDSVLRSTFQRSIIPCCKRMHDIHDLARKVLSLPFNDYTVMIFTLNSRGPFHKAHTRFRACNYHINTYNTGLNGSYVLVPLRAICETGPPTITRILLAKNKRIRGQVPCFFFFLF